MSQCFPSLEVTQTRQQTRGRQILGILGGCARLLELGDRKLLWREYLNSVLRVVHLFWLGNPALSTLARVFAATLTQTQEYSPWDQPKCLCDMGNSAAKIICRFHGHLVVGGRNIKYEIMAAGSLLQNYISEIKGMACQI